MMIATIKLNIGHLVKKELKELAAFQDKDPYIKTWRDHVSNQSAEVQDGRYAVPDGVIRFKNHKSYPFWRPMLPSGLENEVITLVHLSLGHAGCERCIAAIAHSFYVKNLGRKVRKILSCCDVCQSVQQPNRSYEIESRSHVPKKPGGLCALDYYGQLQVGRGSVQYILVCLNVFSKHIKLYTL
jgi:hypothetical protein